MSEGPFSRDAGHMSAGFSEVLLFCSNSTVSEVILNFLVQIKLSQPNLSGCEREAHSHCKKTNDLVFGVLM